MLEFNDIHNVFLYFQSYSLYKEQQSNTEALMSALQDKTSHLENSLSAETRLKLDLFSALGEAKRQMEIFQGLCLIVGYSNI